MVATLVGKTPTAERHHREAFLPTIEERLALLNEGKCDFHCGKTGEPLIHLQNTGNGHRWVCHLSCLKEYLEIEEELRKQGEQ